MIYRVILIRAQSHEAAVELEAEDRTEAINIATERAAHGMVHWVEVANDVDVEAVPQR